MTEQEIFMQAIDRKNLVERSAFINKACGADSVLRRRVNALLEGHDKGHSILDSQPIQLLNFLSPSTLTDDADCTKELLAPFLNPSPRSDALGRVGRYDVLEILGQGGFGIVVKAFDEGLQRSVAIKFLSPLLEASRRARRLFLHEARTVAQLKHDHIVQVHGVEEQPLPYLVMEFIDGLTLQERIDRYGALDPAEAIRIGCQIASGLAAAHSKGLIHRDVKPSNVLIDGEGGASRAKLSDFGLALAEETAKQIQSQVLAGSPLYMAPEQVRGEPLDARVDLFSLGAMLYTMVSGVPPFQASNTFEVLKRVTEESPRPLREVNSNIPHGLVAVINKLLSKSPADRYTTADAANEALANCLDETPSKSTTRHSELVTTGMLYVLLVVTAIGVLGQWAFFQSKLDESHDTNESASWYATIVDRPAIVGDLVVTSTGDEDASGTLRWAITEANNLNGKNVITFDPDVFTKLTTIRLTQGPLILADSALTSIHGPAAGLVVDGNNESQVFIVGAEWKLGSPAMASISDLTITHGCSTERNSGGGVLCQGGSTLTMTGCTLSENSAEFINGGGGAIFVGYSTVNLFNCTLTRNHACEGGAIKNYAGIVKATNCTIVGNSAQKVVGGIYTLGFELAATEVNNCIFMKNSFGDLFLFDGLEMTGDYNLTSDSSAPGTHSKLNANAKLGPLGRYGGPTETFPLLTGSPAIDAGSSDLIPAEITTDQRGAPRSGLVDIGAYEAQ